MTASPTQEVVAADAPAPRGRLVAWLQDSSLPYLGSLVITAMLAGYANYLSPLVFPDGFTIKGQSLAIVIPFVDRVRPLFFASIAMAVERWVFRKASGLVFLVFWLSVRSSFSSPRSMWPVPRW